MTGPDFMKTTGIKPPEEISRQILGAIQGALEEERRPLGLRIAKILLATVVSTLILVIPIALVFRDQMGWVWKAAAAVWAICFLTGFSLYFHPQPRLSVPGYWSPWIFAKILIGMTLLTGLQILLCPSFVFLESPLGISPFLPITEWFMSWGGMTACMFSCGFLFSSLGGMFTFLTVKKVLSRTAYRDLLRAVGVAYFTQLPLIGIQVVDEGLRPFAVHWAMGSVIGLVAVGVLVRFAGRVRGGPVAA